MSDQNRVSCIVPIHNGLEMVQKNLSSWLSCLSQDDELILIDDASTEGVAEWILGRLLEQQPQPTQSTLHTSRTSPESNTQVIEGKMEEHTCRVLLLKDNQRFAKAVNTGVAYAKNPLVLLFNSDVVVNSDVRAVLSSHFFVSSTIFAVGCLEKENEAGTLGGKNVLSFTRGLFEHARATEFSSGPTAWVSGGSGMFDAKKWQALGGFDPRFYPAYWEDVDLSWRAREQGWQVMFDENAVVYHEHESTNATVFSSHQLAQQSFEHQKLFTRLHASPLQLIQYLIWLPYRNLKMNT